MNGPFLLKGMKVMQASKALVIEAPGKISLQERPVGEPGPGEVLVRVNYVALCGSDVKLYTGSYTAPHRYPVVVGHEWLGRVAQCGEGVQGLAPGDLVTGDCSVFCGECPLCAVNKNHCVSIEKSGITVDGKCSQWVVVNRKHIYKCPDMADPKPLVLTEPLSVSVTGITTRVPEAALQRARNAVVLGAGGIGILAALVLREYPIKEIVVADISPEKLALVESFGLPGVRTCRDAAVLDDEYDIVVEAAGQPATLQQCPRLAAPAGHIVMLGHQKSVEMDFGAVMKKSLTIHASNGSTGGFERAMDIIQKRRDIVAQLITKTVMLEDAPGYIANQMANEQNIKVVIDLRGQS